MLALLAAVLAVTGAVTTATWSSTSQGGALCNLAGNWTNHASSTAPASPVHIEFWQESGNESFTLRTTPWGSTLSYGHNVDSKTVDIYMVGARGSMRTTTVSADCNSLGLGWCRFPHCGYPEPKWPAWSPNKPVPPAPPAPAPLPPSGPPSCAHQRATGKCPDPPWPPVYSMELSTVVQPCNASGLWHDSATFGLTSFDWSNAKKVWSTNPNSKTNCSEMLVEQAKIVKQSSDNKTRVFVYRNYELALEWIRGQRAAMYNPAKAGYFLQYQTGAKKGQIYDENQLHGLKQYFWNFSNPAAVEFFISEATGIDAIGNPWVDGIFTDDVDGTFQEHGAAARAIGLSPEQEAQMITDNNAAYDKIIAALVKAGGYDWQAFGSEDGTSGLLPREKGATCASKMRAACKQGANPRLVSMDSTDQGVAAFLISRGKHWWMGSGWAGCSDAPNPDRIRDLDPGTPTSTCTEAKAGVFSRTYTKGNASLDCNTFTATLDFR